MKTIFFICTGNSCRSVMAEGLLKKYLAARIKDFEIGSAGIGTVNGLPPSAETINLMIKEEGVDVSAHRSRQLTREMIASADKIFVMEKMHQDWILHFFPEAGQKMELLTPTGIPDPIRMSEAFYKNVFTVIREGVKKIAEGL